MISTNYAADFLDGSLSRYYLDTLHRISGKPLLVSEYYFCATQNRTGNLNPGAIYPVVENQEARAEAFHRNLESLASLPYVAGAHWFEYRDEPKGGRRPDGEDYNMGLVDIIGRPYEALTAAATAIDVEKIHRAGMRPLTEQSEVAFPPPPADPWAGLTAWPRDRAFVTPRSSYPFADLYVCRDEHTICVGVTFKDVAWPEFYRNQDAFAQDLPRLTLQLDSREPIEVHLLPGDAVRTSSAGARAKVMRTSVRYVLLVGLPSVKSVAVDVSLWSTGGRWRNDWTISAGAVRPRGTEQ